MHWEFQLKRRVVDLFAGRAICTSSTKICKYTRVEVMRMIDLVFVKREIVYDLETMRELIRHLRSFCYIA